MISAATHRHPDRSDRWTQGHCSRLFQSLTQQHHCISLRFPCSRGGELAGPGVGLFPRFRGFVQTVLAQEKSAARVPEVVFKLERRVGLQTLPPHACAGGVATKETDREN